MKEMKINKNLVILKLLEDLCESCKTCSVDARIKSTGEEVIIEAGYCQDGSGYISVSLHKKNGEFLNSCTLKYPTDSCSLPFPDLEIDVEPDCKCDT